MSQLRFSIDDQMRALGVRGAFAIMTGLDNAGAASAALDDWRAELLARLQRDLSPDFIRSDPVLSGFRALHDAIGRSNKRFPASAEALVALFQRKGIMPRINPLVDIYNGVSLETRLSLGAHDLAFVDGNIALRFTTGRESFEPLGATGPEPVTPGEYGYIDSSGALLCRLEHRQCERTRITSATTESFYILQGNANTSRALIEHALAHLIGLTTRFCGGRVEATWVAA